MFTTINPYNQQHLSVYRPIDADQLNHLIADTHRAFLKWRKHSFEHRAALMHNLADLLLKTADQSAELISKEMGKPIQQAKAEINKCAWVCKYYASHAASFLNPEIIQTDAKKSWISYEPLGVVFGIMPWNFPFWQVLRFAAPTLMAGNTVLIKHSPNTFGCSEVISDLFLQAGFEKGLYSNLVIETDQSTQVINHSLVKAISLTGSVRAGADVSSKAALQIKKSVLELGGSNALIIMQDADIEKAVKIGLDGRFQNTGQSCIAVKRILVHRDVYELYLRTFIGEVSKFIVGDPLDPKTDIGPVARLDLAEHLEQQIKDSVKLGAELKVGGSRKGAFVAPTVLLNVKPGMPAFDEELFGPVIAMTVFDDVEEAISLSNQSQFGLGVSICTENPEEIIGYTPNFQEGAVFINEKVMSDPRLPFGGVKKSGIGRELGPHGIREFVNVKTVYVA